MPTEAENLATARNEVAALPPADLFTKTLLFLLEAKSFHIVHIQVNMFLNSHIARIKVNFFMDFHIAHIKVNIF